MDYKTNIRELCSRMGNITYSANYEKVREILQNVKSDDLVLFDVDETLIVPKDSCLRPSASKIFDSIFYETFKNADDEKEALLYSKWITQVEMELTDSRFPSLIDELNKKTTVIGFTRMIPGPGKCGDIPRMEDYRFQTLKKLGICMTNEVRKRGNFVLDIPLKYGREQLFKDGILYAIDPKKDILKQFLKQLEWKPTKVWFVDDLAKNLNGVADVCSKLGIEYEGIEYILDQRDDGKLNNEKFDEKTGRFQYNYFVNHEIWLNDKEVKLRLLIIRLFGILLIIFMYLILKLPV